MRLPQGNGKDHSPDDHRRSNGKGQGTAAEPELPAFDGRGPVRLVIAKLPSPRLPETDANVDVRLAEAEHAGVIQRIPSPPIFVVVVVVRDERDVEKRREFLRTPVVQVEVRYFK